MGGLSHFGIDSAGNVNPCVYLPVTFGNILEEEFPVIYERMRASVPRPIHAECPCLALADTLRREQRGGGSVPVRHERIREDWERVVTSPERSGAPPPG